ncbi:hypothetical protein Rhal01_02560 [Rubritalea halochordaticola]|uniref:HEAT repeat domain-containing protein n=1 Tax=Rubritalea halochordaticola TaxID=714537 RepID=A0ABP9V138_9BACT
MRYLTLFFLLLSITAHAAQPSGEAPWSETSNGLQARISMERSHVSNGTAIIATYLELKNVRNLISPMLVSLDDKSLSFKVSNEQGEFVARQVGPFSGMVVQNPALVLPHEGTLRFRIGSQGHGVPADHAALLDLGSSHGWALPKDGRTYHLHAELEIKPTDEKGHWHGKVTLPKVLIPTEPEPVDPATLGPIIEELGTKMLEKDQRIAAPARKKLSLIDDPRVIPWYVKAMKSDSSSLRKEALDRLSRLPGNEALKGLIIGMKTQPKDIGHVSTPEQAKISADAVRHSAAIALERSKHPLSTSLLLSMHDDPYYFVRIRVIQAAAKIKTPEALGILRQHTEDSEERVRNEAIRLLKALDPTPVG